MSHTLVTGFTPFDGRTVNASWIAARSLAPEARTLEVPVIWGRPLELLGPICEEECPHTIIAMGEGREGWFDIETVARNRRNERADNAGTLPDGVPIIDQGAEQVEASINARAVQKALLGDGYPTRISTDAGAFLCEEMLYSLEQLRRLHATLQTVIFVHLPPFGTTVGVNETSQPCTEPLLEQFARTLMNAVSYASRSEENVDNAQN